MSICFSAGCGDETQTSSPVQTKQEQQKVDPKVDYVNKLNDLQIKNDLKVIAQYGITIQQFDPENKNEIKTLKDVHKDGIPKYEHISSELKSMKVPDEYKTFHKLLQDTIDNFIGTMKEMDQHLDNVEETDHLTKSTAYYIVSTESAKKLVKELPYGELN
jgi:esterase/lipase